MRKYYRVFLLMLFPLLVNAQEGSDYAELSLGAGMSNEGLTYGASIDMSILNIAAGVRGTQSGEIFGIGSQKIKDLGFFAGYGHHKTSYSLVFALGYAVTNYKCFSSSGNGCHGYNGGSYWGPTGHGRMTIRLSERTGLGVIGFINLNRRSDLYSVLVTLALSL